MVLLILVQAVFQLFLIFTLNPIFILYQKEKKKSVFIVLAFTLCHLFPFLASYIVFLSELPGVFSHQFSHSVMSDSLQPHGLQHARPPCPLPTPGADSNSCPSSQ